VIAARLVTNCQRDGSNAVACGLAGEVVRTFGEIRLRVFGTSMAPSILPRDLISVQCAGLDEIAPGETVVFTRNGGLVVHRVVAKTTTLSQSYLITRGDRLRQNDPPVSSSELLGRVHLIERGRRRLQPAVGLSMSERIIALLLRSSDRATYLYVRLATRWQKPFAKRAENWV
jgi:signal peptidase I